LHNNNDYSIVSNLMPKVKRKTKAKTIKETANIISEEKYEIPESQKSRNIFSLKNILLLLVILALVGLWFGKKYFIAGTVNGQPISKWQLNAQLEKRFGSQVLDSIINERLILSAARQKSIFVTEDDINNKIKQVEEQIKGQMSLDEALKAQGLTKEDFKKQIEIQVSIDKMFDKEASVSTKDVDDYLSKNSSLTKSASDAAALKKEVEDMLKQQKVAELFNTWFTEIRKNAKIENFLKI
jgi:hypothetical protein